MDQSIPNPSQHGDLIDPYALTLATLNSNALANLPPEAQLATVRQMMQTLFARVDSLQQNQAIQLAGVHDRLDAVELELPLIQEQGALRIRDLETRMSVEIDQAARYAVEEATNAATSAAALAATAAVQEEVMGKFSTLQTQIEHQRVELSQMRESKKLADTRLNQAISDIERLCGDLTPRGEEDPVYPRIDPVASPYRSRVSEHIRKAALDLAPGEENPLSGNAPLKRDSTQPHAAMTARPTGIPAAAEKAMPVEQPVVSAAAEARVAPPASAVSTGEALTPAVSDPSVENVVPGFDSWKRQFMQNGEPHVPAFAAETAPGNAVICPRCYSDRTRPATLNRLDHLYRLARFTPHRCRSCAHRFYKRLGSASMVHNDEDAMETR